MTPYADFGRPVVSRIVTSRPLDGLYGRVELLSLSPLLEQHVDALAVELGALPRQLAPVPVHEAEVGEQQRQIVAGIAKYYKPEELVGKTIVIVENLKPAKIRGVMSHGMLLAAESKEGIILLTTDKPISTGAIVK